MHRLSIRRRAALSYSSEWSRLENGDSRGPLIWVQVERHDNHVCVGTTNSEGVDARSPDRLDWKRDCPTCEYTQLPSIEIDCRFESHQWKSVE